jgi:hypothetical protein
MNQDEADKLTKPLHVQIETLELVLRAHKLALSQRPRLEDIEKRISELKGVLNHTPKTDQYLHIDVAARLDELTSLVEYIKNTNPDASNPVAIKVKADPSLPRGTAELRTEIDTVEITHLDPLEMAEQRDLLIDLDYENKD